MHDYQLLQDYVKHDSQSAFATLVERYSSLVYSASLREVQDSELAQDVTQVVFLLLAKKASTFRAETVLAGWLFQTARFASKDALKQEVRRQRREQKAAEEMMRESQINDDNIEWSEMEPALNEALISLGPDDRNAVLLRFFQKKSLRETGEIMGLSEDAARMKVSRAVDKMRRHFKRRGFALSAGALATYLSANATQAAPAACISAAMQLGNVFAAGTTAGAASAGVSAVAARLMASAANTQVATLFHGVSRTLLLNQAKVVVSAALGTALVGIGVAKVAPLFAGGSTVLPPRIAASFPRVPSSAPGEIPVSAQALDQKANLPLKAQPGDLNVVRTVSDSASQSALPSTKPFKLSAVKIKTGTVTSRESVRGQEVNALSTDLRPEVVDSLAQSDPVPPSAQPKVPSKPSRNQQRTSAGVPPPAQMPGTGQAQSKPRGNQTDQKAPDNAKTANAPIGTRSITILQPQVKQLQPKLAPAKDNLAMPSLGEGRGAGLGRGQGLARNPGLGRGPELGLGLGLERGQGLGKGRDLKPDSALAQKPPTKPVARRPDKTSPPAAKPEPPVVKPEPPAANTASHPDPGVSPEQRAQLRVAAEARAAAISAADPLSRKAVIAAANEAYRKEVARILGDTRK